MRYYKICFACFLIIIILHCSYRYIWCSDETSSSVRKSVGPTKLNLSINKLSDVEHEYAMVKDGGYYYPSNCSTDQKIAIIVSYRNRPINMAIFLYNMHPILMEQQLEYQIFIIEQAGNDIFNKGCLYNAGFKEVMKLKKFRCIIFHDLDLLPMFRKIHYTCPTLPRHMSSFIDDGSPMKPGGPNKYQSLFGGVVALTTEMVYSVNGYSNVYFGWGAEDDDMFWRLRAAGYGIVRYKTTTGIFKMLPHIRAPRNKLRHFLLATTVERYKVDGLSSLEYAIIKYMSHHLYTHILVDIDPQKQNITALMMKWVSGNNSL